MPFFNPYPCFCYCHHHSSEHLLIILLERSFAQYRNCLLLSFFSGILMPLMCWRLDPSDSRRFYVTKWQLHRAVKKSPGAVLGEQLCANATAGPLKVIGAVNCAVEVLLLAPRRKREAWLMAVARVKSDVFLDNNFPF